MANDFGVTFAPLPDPTGSTTGRNLQPVQQAIQLLSLRVPRVLGAAAPVSASLLNAPSNVGNPTVHSAVLQTVLRTLFGPAAGSINPTDLTPLLHPESPVPMPRTPTPREDPGVPGVPTQPTTPIRPPQPPEPIDKTPLKEPRTPHVILGDHPGEGGTPHDDSTLGPPDVPTLDEDELRTRRGRGR